MPALYMPSEMTDPPTGENQEDQRTLLWQILCMVAYPTTIDRASNRTRGTVIIESGTVTTVTTVTTVSTVTSMSQIDSIQGRLLMFAAQIDAWYNSVRARL